jgi:16S rRNA (uracil1498-N3)-methyltransferase
MRRLVAHVFVDDLSAPAPVLTENDVHHLSRVLRLRPGETVSVSDGQGTVQVCEWAGGPELEPVGPAVRHRRPTPLVTVGFALTKGDHPEWAVQKLTEAGADRVIVVMAARCVARWPTAKQGRQLERLREVARQAAMQSRRAWLPVVDGPVPFTDLVADLRRLGPADPVAGGRGAGMAPVSLAVPGSGPISLSTPTVLVGPEGGWTDDELAAVPHHVGLGPHVMRAETAAVAAGVLLAALRAHLVAETA